MKTKKKLHKGIKKTTEQFITEARFVHGDKYDYSEVKYVRNKDKVSIICQKHGVYKQIPLDHLKGRGCSECGNIKSKESLMSSVLAGKNWDFEQPLDYKLIPLTQGKFAMVDNEDFDRVKGINWCYSNGYAINHEYGGMHRYILNALDELDVDHIKQENTLDNRKSNIRLATHLQNMRNTRPRKNSTSRYKGVCWCNRSCKWRSYIYINNKLVHLGYFEDEKESGRVYDLKALECWGEFAYLNFPELKEEYLKQIENLKFL